MCYGRRVNGAARAGQAQLIPDSHRFPRRRDSPILYSNRPEPHSPPAIGAQEQTTVNPLDPTVLVVGLLITTILFAVIAFFTRATPRRIAGALIGAIPVVPLVMVYDAIAARLGWWHYPSVTTGSAPLAW